MEAVRCPVCKLLVAPGDYAGALLATPGNHEAKEGEDGYAIPAEARSCPGGEMLGEVAEDERPVCSRCERPVSELVEGTELCEDCLDAGSICSTCNGSGEGMYDGSTCRECGGSGDSDHPWGKRREPEEDCDPNYDDRTEDEKDYDADRASRAYEARYR